MGRGVMVHPDAEATVYRTLPYTTGFCHECEIDTFDEENCPECGADLIDHDGEHAGYEFEYLVDWIREEFGARFPSMEPCDRWAHGCGAMDELHCIMANYLCDVYISEYCGMVAISVVPTGEESYVEDTHGLAVHWTATYASDVLDKFSEYAKLGTMSNGESVFREVAA